MDELWLGEKTNEEGEVTMKHHPDEVWIFFGFQKNEPWKKVKILRPTGDNQQTPVIVAAVDRFFFVV